MKVELSFSLIVEGVGVSNPQIRITAKNVGQKAVILNTEGLLLPDNKQVFFPLASTRVKFPHQLQPEQSCDVFTDAKQLARTLKEEGYYGEIKLIGYYRDQIGRMYKSKKWKFNVDEWA